MTQFFNNATLCHGILGCLIAIALSFKENTQPKLSWCQSL